MREEGGGESREKRLDFFCYQKGGSLYTKEDTENVLKKKGRLPYLCLI